MNAHISTVISTCYIKDIKIWAKVAPALPLCIEAAAYKVIVPQNEVRIFRQITPPNIDVVSENDVLETIDVYQTAAMLGSKKRAGWYYQQLLKIHALSQGHPDDVNLIWDADTLPLKKLAFVSEDNKLMYRVGDEYNQPYFTHISKSLSLDRIIDHSFIAQCFPAKCSWVAAYIATLESHNKSSWITAIIDNIDRSELFGFSEYESMGTFFTHNFADSICFSDAKWERFGNSKIGIQGISPEVECSLAANLDYISFESWDVPDRMPELGVNKTICGFLDVFFAGAEPAYGIQVGGTPSNAITCALQNKLVNSNLENITHIVIDSSDITCNKLKEIYSNSKNITVINARCSNQLQEESGNRTRHISISNIRIASNNKNLLLIISMQNNTNAVLNTINWRFPPKYIILPVNTQDATTSTNTITAKGYKQLCIEAEYTLFILSK